METFEDVIVKVKKSIEKAGEKAGQVWDVKKLKISAADLKYKIKKDYAKLGKAAYLSSKDEIDRAEEIEAIVGEIDLKIKALHDVEDKICEAENKTRCACGYVNPAEAVFCNICGQKLAGE